MSQMLTERLLLRTLTRADMDHCYLASAAPSAGWKPHGSREETRHLMETVFIGKDSVWGIVLRESDQLVGSIGLMRDYKRDNDRSRSIGYAIDEDCWGKGYMPEAVRAVLGYGFERMGLDLISAYTYPWNKRSKRVLEKCGFRYEATLVRAEKLFDGSIQDNDCYVLLKEDWEKN